MFDVYSTSIQSPRTECFQQMNHEAYFLKLLTSINPAQSGRTVVCYPYPASCWTLPDRVKCHVNCWQSWHGDSWPAIRAEAACRPGLVQCGRITTFTPNHVLCVATAVNDRPVNGIAPRMLCSGLRRPARLDRPGLVQYCTHII